MADTTMTQQRAEIALARTAAIHELTATGATRAEAHAVVDEHIRRAMQDDAVRAERNLAVIADAWDAVQPGIEALFRRIGAAFASLTDASRTTRADVVLHPAVPLAERDRALAVIDRRRRGGHAGPAAPRMDRRPGAR